MKFKVGQYVWYVEILLEILEARPQTGWYTVMDLTNNMELDFEEERLDPAGRLFWVQKGNFFKSKYKGINSNNIAWTVNSVGWVNGEIITYITSELGGSNVPVRELNENYEML